MRRCHSLVAVEEKECTLMYFSVLSRSRKRKNRKCLEVLMINSYRRLFSNQILFFDVFNQSNMSNGFLRISIDFLHAISCNEESCAMQV